MTTLALDDLYEAEWSDDALPQVDRSWPGRLTPRQLHWREHGWLTVERLIPDDLIDRYCNEWRAENLLGHDNGQRVFRMGGWPDAVPYMRHEVLRELCCYGPLHRILHELIGEPMGVHLNLTGWETTGRDWHSDQYLNEPYVGGFYTAVWVALDDIHPMSGPFQFVDGSHRWPPLSQAKVRAALGEDGRGPDWPAKSERILTPLFERKIADHEVTTYLPGKGSVLIWHGRLLHRGSKAVIPNMERRSCILHLSGINHRPDMPKAVQHETEAGHFFPIMQGPPVR